MERTTEYINQLSKAAQAVKELNNAAQKLIALWLEESNDGELSTPLLNGMYPFETDFRDVALGIDEWNANVQRNLDAILTEEGNKESAKIFADGYAEMRADIAAKYLGVELNNFSDENARNTILICNNSSCWIEKMPNGEYFTDVMNQTVLGTFDECVKLIRENL